MPTLSAETAYIFRITHRDNVPWLLGNGLYCQNSDVKDPNFVPIGMADLIHRRQHRKIEVGPGGTLSDYVPFYFTPWSVMMLNIKTGYNGVTQRPNNEIVVLVSSIPRLVELNVRFVFTDAHAYSLEAECFESLKDLRRIDWQLLTSRNFSRDPEDPGKLSRYQAEALVYQHVPVEALLGIACYDTVVRDLIAADVERRSLACDVKCLPSWYF